MLELYWVFCRIGLFTVGGGLVMISLVAQELQARGWMSFQETADMVAISQMTPGPFAVNAATFVGMRMEGVLGGIVATLGVMSTSLVITMLVARYFFRIHKAPAVQAVFACLRPTVTALVVGTVWFMFTEATDVFSIVIMAAAFLALQFTKKISPVMLIFAAGLIGVAISFI